jgi:hypothetical protein
MFRQRLQPATVLVVGGVLGIASAATADAATVWFKMTADQTTLLVNQTTEVRISVMAEPSRPVGQGVASWEFDLDIVPQPGTSPVQVLGAVTFLADFAGNPFQPFTNSEVAGEIRAFGAGTTSFNAGINGQYTDVARFTLQALQIGTASYKLGVEGLFEAYVMGSGPLPELATPAWAQSQFVIDVVPEPVSILGLMALCGMAFIRRRW